MNVDKHLVGKVIMIIGLQFVVYNLCLVSLPFKPIQVEYNARNARTKNSYLGFVRLFFINER